ncbi:MAG TPA: cytochrome c oxidase accessory protein CcoG [Geminicoccus sp.]|jgi:cytochrome c oxidase accessory protein FixG|uniref:cytochrome c oxidase accessory protein CcoG n=1 Tax=Geminicoccus sp. TaxID=2024832 RepID=UPI002E331435|nr:cytochrome c oxidase accessory protein CcoG [Geminicoccus sp.]HEX2525010.1 cytochrome c oxidase accessory protein CcoG [Geminicoccus sp.]
MATQGIAAQREAAQGLDLADPAAERVLPKRKRKEPSSANGKIYPRSVRGQFRTIKWAALCVLLGIYYILPWIRWDRGPDAPDQALLFDFIRQRIYLFGIEIWPQEIYYATGLLILAALGLFLATSLFGRIWCGYACPQTVWTDLFMWVERRIEGDRRERMKLDAQPNSTGKIALKVAKHAVWLLIAMLTGGAFVMYFNDAPTLLRQLPTGQAGGVTYFFFGLFTLTTYLLAGWARETVCNNMCPWPRIQGGLLDQDSLTVTYRDWRGEPRGPHKRGESWEGRGDCIDCHQCFMVCPTGVDIRKGLQLDCIGCGLCIDACNEVMAKVDRPPFLISWDSARNQQLNAAGKPGLWRLVRPRTAVYAGLFVAVAVFMSGVFALRSNASVDALHDPAPLFVQLSDGSIRNGYSLKIRNTEHAASRFELGVVGFPARYRLIGDTEDRALPPVVTADPDGVTTVRLFVILPHSVVHEPSMEIGFVLRNVDTDEIVRTESIFRGRHS